ncbi:MAG: hypothetical protein ACRBK7_17210 [Acidimicrobiales bacterium]
MVRDSFLIGFLVRIPWIGPRVVFRLQRAGLGFTNRDWPSLAERVIRLRPATLSVDVFDTCVVRDLSGDAAIEHVIDGGPAIASDMERVLCRPVPGAAEALVKIRSAGTEVVFVSDTDRSSELLIEILRSSGIFVDGDRLVASCEAAATKSDGTLLPQLFSTEQRSKRRKTTWHAGNHIWADVTMAAAAGLNPVPMLDADVNRYEDAMGQRPEGYGPALAASARTARLRIEDDRRTGVIDDRQAAVQALGADVAGQVMTAFVLWVSEQCRAQKIDHVGFLARDGELPLLLAQAIPADHWDGRSLRYIQASRFTWSLAAASALGIDQWLKTGASDDGGFLHAKRHHVPFEALLARVGLSQADLASDPEHRWLAGLESGRPLPEEAVADWEGLLADPKIHGTIQDRADERLKLIVDRLRADGLPAGKFALVDVGWRGRLATQVSAVLSEVVGEPPVHFHFGGDKVLPDADASVPIHRFAFDGYSSPHPIDAPVSCIETITASGKPRVVEYRRRADGQVDMIFDEPVEPVDYGAEELWVGAVRTAESIPSRAVLSGWGLRPDSLADEAIAVLDHWWNRPTPQEVEALSNFTFEHDEAGTALRPLLTPYRLRDLGADRRAARRQWPQGSLAASSQVMSTAVRMSKFLRRPARR